MFQLNKIILIGNRD